MLQKVFAVSQWKPLTQLLEDKHIIHYEAVYAACIVNSPLLSTLEVQLLILRKKEQKVMFLSAYSYKPI